MARYDYRFAPASPGQLKLLESLSWGAIALFIVFTLALFRMPAFNHLLQTHWPIYLGCLALLYVVFMLPSRRMLRLKKYGSTWVETSRKGLTFHGRLPAQENGEEKTLSWRDLSRATIWLDATPSVGVYVKRLDLTYAKSRRLRLDNEAPKYSLNGDLALLSELQERLPEVEQNFVWYYPVCPYCRSAQLLRDAPCATCGQRVRFRQKMGRPQDVWGEDTPYLILFLLFSTLGASGLMLGSIIASGLLWSLVIPLIFARPSKLRTIQERRSADA
ncbi:MAG: hypothetical protein ACYCW6_16390 [Candidatus Xenobia bacterium]